MRDVLDLLLPCPCVECGGLCLGRESRVWCVACCAKLPRWLWPRREPLEGVRTAWTLGEYTGPVGAAVRRAKYGQDRAALGELSARLAQAAAGRLPRVDGVVPVPQRLGASLERGMWPTAVLAQAVSQALERPWSPALRRVGGAPQAGLDAAARRQNVAGAYAAVGELALRRVLLVDDVLTTGATVEACAAELLCAGAREVHVLAVCEA